MKRIFKTSLICMLFFGTVVILDSCNKEQSDTDQKTILMPSLSTTAVSSVTTLSAVSGGSISSEGGAAVSERGVCWATSANPTILSSKTSDGFGAGIFSSTITGLTANTTYYLRAYATNIGGTAYGEQIMFTTQVDYTGQTGTVTDVDGNTYPTIGIGNQIWMASNLKTTKYRSGVLIGTTNPATQDISAESTPKYQWAYGGNENNAAVYGRLYSWYAVTDTRNVCPVGWHIPTDAEWTTLTNFLGGESSAGNKLKEAGTSHWTIPNTSATNSSGFTALPGGNRDGTGTFSFNGANGGWWSSTENNTTFSWFRFLFYDSGLVSRGYFNKSFGFSVRCIKDL
jgi:uncharacterized protein (TIGR02145 family)